MCVKRKRLSNCITSHFPTVTYYFSNVERLSTGWCRQEIIGKKFVSFPQTSRKLPTELDSASEP